MKRRAGISRTTSARSVSRQDEIARGKALLDTQRDAAIARVPNLAALTDRSVAELSGGDADGEALLAFLRAHPEALRTGDLPLDLAASKLAHSLEAFRAGERERALDLAISSYLDGFEPVEPALNVVDSALRKSIEAEYIRYRDALREGRPLAEVSAIHRSVEDGLAQAEQRLAGNGLGPKAVFTGALTILAREGLEAVLLVVAILGVLARSGRRDALRFVHAGWIAALAAGAATWWVASRFVAMSGASREVVEGVSALTATAILFYVSYWLLSKTESARWQSFLGDRLKTALSSGSLGMLAFVTFVAVYRECFETVLFYQALAAQAGPAGTGSALRRHRRGRGAARRARAHRLPLRQATADAPVLRRLVAAALRPRDRPRRPGNRRFARGGLDPGHTRVTLPPRVVGDLPDLAGSRAPGRPHARRAGRPADGGGRVPQGALRSFLIADGAEERDVATFERVDRPKLAGAFALAVTALVASGCMTKVVKHAGLRRERRGGLPPLRLARRQAGRPRLLASGRDRAGAPHQPARAHRSAQRRQARARARDPDGVALSDRRRRRARAREGGPVAGSRS